MPWKESGISQELLSYSAALGDICDTPMARIQISRGALWVKHIASGNNTSGGVVVYHLVACACARVMKDPTTIPYSSGHPSRFSESIVDHVN